MTIQSGFFDSVESDRLYSAAQMNRILNGIISDGVLRNYEDAFAPTADGSMMITVGTGRAWFNDTWTRNDGEAYFTIDEGEPALDRWDIIVLEVNKTTRYNSLQVIKGTPSGSPELPGLISTDYIIQYILVIIHVDANVTGLYTEDIQNWIGQGIPLTPYASTITDIDDAETDAKGLVELATTAEVDAGTDTERAVTPVALENSARSVKLDAIEALADKTDATNVAAAGAMFDLSDDPAPQLAANLDLGNNLLLVSIPGIDHTAEGIGIIGNVGGNAHGFAAMLRMSADGIWREANALAATLVAPAVGMALETGTGATKKVLLKGAVRDDSWNWTIGAGHLGLIYLSTTVGGMTQTQPSGSGDAVQVVGFALSADSMYFDPSLTYLIV